MISNQPRIKGKTTFAYTKIEQAFSEDELGLFLEYCDSRNKNLKNATVIGKKNAPQVRISQTWFENKNTENAWFFERMNQVIDFANNEFYNFDLWGYEKFQYGEYRGDELGKYDLHADMLTDDVNESNFNTYHEGTRKLSATLMLNQQGEDFEGGDFVVAISGEDNAEVVNLSAGSIVVFPSFITHAVKPVTSGIRKSAVIWVVGPKFR
jgi:PKHD-type hydroxylase